MAKNGWVKLHRKILQTELTPSQFKFFVGAILLAETAKSKNSGVVNLSVRTLGKELGMEHTAVWRKERELAAMEMITPLPKPQKGFIINNYHYYQTGKVLQIDNTLQEKGVAPEQQSVAPEQQSVAPEQQSVANRVPEPPPKKGRHIESKKGKKGKEIVKIGGRKYEVVN